MATSALTQPQGPHSEEGDTALPSGPTLLQCGKPEPLSSGSPQTEQRQGPCHLKGRSDWALNTSICIQGVKAKRSPSPALGQSPHPPS